MTENEHRYALSCLRMQASSYLWEIPAFAGMTENERSYALSCLRMQASSQFKGEAKS
jgi:hypothetical protein